MEYPEHPTNPDLIGILAADGQVILVNVALVRRVDEIRFEHCKLWFSETDCMEINGSGAGHLLGHMAKRAVSIDGIPMKDFIKTVTKSE